MARLNEDFEPEISGYTVKCPHCGTKYKGNRCPDCGRITEPGYEAKRRTRKFFWITIGIMAFIALSSIGCYALFFHNIKLQVKEILEEPETTTAVSITADSPVKETDTDTKEQLQVETDVETYLAENWDGETSVWVQDQILEVVLCASGDIPDFLDDAQAAASEISRYASSDQDLIRSTVTVKAGLDFTDDIYLTFFDEKLFFRADEAGEYQEPNDEFITLDEFNQIQDGMTYQDVVNIIGSTGELVSSADIGDPQYVTKMYSWEGKALGANAVITFQGGTVYGKSQFGLE